MLKHTLLLLNRILRYKIYIGKDITTVGPRSIVVFPYVPGMLCCGLAGLLTIKKSISYGIKDPFSKLSGLFSEISDKGLKQVLSGKLVVEEYLGGPENLAGLAETVGLWKLGVYFRDIFFNKKELYGLKKKAALMSDFLVGEEKALEINAGRFSTEDLEIVNSRLIILKDAQWALERDILQNVNRISELAGNGNAESISAESLNKYRQVNFLLNCLDRLEVRGRDSAGIHLSFAVPDGKKLQKALQVLRSRNLYDSFLARTKAGELLNGSIQVCRRPRQVTLSFTYKTASIIGELGRNVRELRRSIRSDEVFRVFSALDVEFEVSLAHTRWASVGSITEENCHPVNNFCPNPNRDEQLPPGGFCAIAESINFDACAQKLFPAYGKGNWCINVALNGDIDNYTALREHLESEEAMAISPELTTDTKIIPLQIEKYLRQGKIFEESFRLALNDFEGSHAIAVATNLEPGKLFLALRGSGQAIYIGICPDQFVFSSELYGLVEATPNFIKMDGEEEAVLGSTNSRGQIFILDQAKTSGIEGIAALFYNGMPLNIPESSLKNAEMTTRDIDRGEYPHFFLKEITEAALSVHKTLRGKYWLSRKNSQWELLLNLGDDILPERIRQDLAAGKIQKIYVIGHGTAAVAGTAIADGLQRYLPGTGIKIEAKKASELSGFSLGDDLRGTLIIPVTQSGTTTDTNRAVAMAGERGAYVIAIVNRRQSDITHKADGVFYTSDGRDIEMSVASTKAFYSQIVAGHILGLAMGRIMGSLSDD